MIPTRLLVDGVPWVVEVTDDMDDGYVGLTKRRKGVVLLGADMSSPMRELTFWHELIHVICTSRDLKFHSGDDEAIEEQIATLLGPALYSFFQANVHILWQVPTIE